MTLTQRLAITVALLVVIFLAGVMPASAQKVVPRVKTILQTLPLEKQEWMRDFHERVESYIRARDWHDKNYGGEIHVNMEFLLQDNSTSSEERYSVNLLVSNGEDLQYFDKRCRFKYTHGEQISVNDPEQLPLTNLIDFYVYLILGGEFDKRGTLEGTPFYEKARDIAQHARYGLGRFVEGWDLREKLVKDLLSDAHRPFREMVDYYFYGLSLVGEDDAQARKYCAEAVNLLVNLLSQQPKNDHAAKFVDAHRREMIAVLANSPEATVLHRLAQVDSATAKAVTARPE
ncbi:MAG: DUF4835 family protein [candidate division KSB1 bacterium]|nr:DUF4835 family protein [candidate division KSB1 bacterium]MDZ7412869.1 DUF4835 family protein [candidate division KSB1 bacterium]